MRAPYRPSNASETPHLNDVVRGGSLSGGNPLQQHAERALVCGYYELEGRSIGGNTEDPPRWGGSWERSRSPTPCHTEVKQ